MKGFRILICLIGVAGLQLVPASLIQRLYPVYTMYKGSEYFMLIYGSVCMVFFLAVLFIINMGRMNDKKTRQLQQQNEQLTKDILIKQGQLEKINRQVENREPVESVSLSVIENKVLDMYERSNIKIPVDVIEELHRQQFYDEMDVRNYIENQRYFWKLENTKKLFKMDVKS